MYTNNYFFYAGVTVSFPKDSTVIDPPCHKSAKPHVLVKAFGKKVEFKHCSGCGKWLPIPAFCEDISKWDHKHNHCSACDALKNAEYFKRKHGGKG